MSLDPLATPTRIALLGDVHANTAWTRSAIAEAKHRGADVVVQLGDYAFDFLDSFRYRIQRSCARAGIPLLFIDGNHDDHDWLRALPTQPNGLRRVSKHVWHLPRAYRWQWQGVQFVALGGAVSVDKRHRVAGVSWWAGETISTADAERTVAGGRADVLIAHDCPAGVPIPGLADTEHHWPAAAIRESQQHRALLRSVVDTVQPRWIFHGHYHRAYTWTGDLGYGPVTVTGLDRDNSTWDANLHIVDLAELAVRRPR